ncbi:hypothetical protein [Natrialbaceae archaeon AArc-T1-2]|uniref:hypothetical protein n=1 Tax=Natrialbaceae archaeon AArc-T1-2 TaxID=3053904 RepID=UPI00255AC688|nr:hypothetical protein [Natrialbaceae archaeon AArc-T1-2]WIV68902.1 hypothetical protein QQ977_17140 [Natrialbaceae archaeon AArc-T1-2]
MVDVINFVFTWLQEWSEVVAGLGSIVLTAGLVYLYSRQTSIQEEQQDLLRRDLNREVRMGHTETLRKRIRAWHGDMDEIGVKEGGAWFTDETNLPKVTGVDVESAPPLVEVVGQEVKFRVVPEALEDDRYLQDLLENHADDLRELKEEIEQQYEEFDGAREAFYEEYPGGPTVETVDYTLQPRQAFTEWVFERAVLLNRKQRDREKQKMKNIVEDRLKGTNSADPGSGEKYYSASGIEDRGPATYEASAVSGDYDDIEENEEEIDSRLIDIHWDAIDEIGEDELYEYAVEAAAILDEMAETVEELKAKLVEHEGNPVYQEDCEYVEEVTL